LNLIESWHKRSRRTACSTQAGFQSWRRLSSSAAQLEVLIVRHSAQGGLKSMARHRITTLALAAVCTALPLTVVSAAGANAATNSTAGFGVTKCSDIGNGKVCATGISGSPDGYDAAYQKWSGATVTARFKLMCTNGFSKWDNGTFTISAGQRKSFVFSVGDQGSCRVMLYSGGSYFNSPYVVIP
jgi:hypothetical protein